MTKAIWKVHALAECLDCGVEFTHYVTVQELAAKHAKKYRHTVSGEVGFAFTYNGKEPHD